MTSPGPRLDVITIFPEFIAPLRQSLLGKALERGQWELRVHDLRSWTDDRHRSVDDTPYGGGPGMVMTPQPWGRALDELAGSADPTGPVPRFVIPTPAGRPFTQAVAAELAAESWLIFGCGRYEGIDARVPEYAATMMQVDEISIGDYVLCGGEAAVIVIAEALLRLVPGVLGNAQSVEQESFSAATDGLLEAPVYTKPALWRGLPVPDVLLSGDHGAIEKWRTVRSRDRTTLQRPDLL